MRILGVLVLSLLVVLTCGTGDDAAAYQWSFNSDTGHWYTLTQEVGQWTEAASEAQQLGGYLVTINDADEESWLRTTFSDTYTYWIGFTDADYEGTWVWTGDPSSTYTNWVPGEPNNMTVGTAEPGWEQYQNSDGEHYAIMNWIVGENDEFSGWNDVPNIGPWYAQPNGVLGIVEAQVQVVPLPASFLLLAPVLVRLALSPRLRTRRTSRS